MALYQCKACGGSITPNEDGHTGKCDYCGIAQTLPKDKDEKISQILNRANDFRRVGDFDRAIFEYEKVLELDETEPEAHWGVFLSRYGVVYVDDKKTNKYKPTLNRISSVSVYDDIDYQATLKYCSSLAAGQYKKDADELEQIMREFLFLSSNETPYDVFISYKELDDVTRQRTDDSYLAHDLYNILTGLGYKVFFAPRSLVGVKLFEPKIYSAIISSKAMIVLGTRTEYLEGVWVKNEWSRFIDLIDKGEEKILVPVFKNMKANEFPSRFSPYQAYNRDDISFLDDLKTVLVKWVKRDSHINFDKDASAEKVNLERGFLALEKGDFEKADFYFEKTLDCNPHNSQAYFGKLMVEMGITKQSEILISEKYLKEYANFEMAVRFADHQLKVTLLQYEEKVKYTIDEQKYNRATALINKANLTESDCKEAAEIFRSINGFKDSNDKEKYCIEQAEICRKDNVLSSGINACGDFTNITQLNCAVDYFKSIPGWKDADKRLAICEERIKKILAAEKRRKLLEKSKSALVAIWGLGVFGFVAYYIVWVFANQGVTGGIMCAIVCVPISVLIFVVGRFIIKKICEILGKPSK